MTEKILLSFDAELRGAGLRPGGPARCARLTIGQGLLLAREPENPVDVRAVAVSDLLGGFVGYVAAERAGPLSVLMEAGALPLCWVRRTARVRRVGGRARLAAWPVIRVEVRAEEASSRSSVHLVREER